MNFKKLAALNVDHITPQEIADIWQFCFFPVHKAKLILETCVRRGTMVKEEDHYKLVRP